MKRKRISYLIPTLYLLSLFLLTASVYLVKKYYENYNTKENFNNITFVSNNIMNRSIPVITNDDILNNPYISDEVEIIRYCYNASDELTQKEKAIVFYGDTYMPNTGIDYASGNAFDVLTIYDGTVIDVLEDELLGKTVKIRHNGEIISVYQGIDNVEVKKGDVVFTGQKIATSGTNKINKGVSNLLHLEIIYHGEVIDPLKCLGKKLGDI